MARNLVAAGHNITVYDLDDAAVEVVVDAGTTGESSSSDAVAGAEVVFLS